MDSDSLGRALHMTPVDVGILPSLSVSLLSQPSALLKTTLVILGGRANLRLLLLRSHGFRSFGAPSELLHIGCIELRLSPLSCERIGTDVLSSLKIGDESAGTETVSKGAFSTFTGIP